MSNCHDVIWRWKWRYLLAIVAFVVAAYVLINLASAVLAGDLPNLEITPGAARTDNCAAIVCTRKWGKDARHVTAAMKLSVFKSYGLTGNKDRSCKGKRHFEIDHLWSRELCGDDVVENLWPQCYSGRWNAVMKDRLENRLHKEVCAGNITLEQAQHEIGEDWRKPYVKYFGEP